ncbi:MAG: hypothetical protein LC745_06090, partial [Planctomycetia bacterium]|nr:hypothetical protein [Planctomycetia bacterium]
MSVPIWTTSAARPAGEDAEGALNPQADPHVPPAVDAPAIEPDAQDEAEAGSTRLRPRLRRETRFGIAALLSFLILVTVLIVNKGRGKDKTLAGKGPPVARIGAGSGSTAPLTPTGPEALLKPQDVLTHVTTTPPPNRTPPPPDVPAPAP